MAGLNKSDNTDIARDYFEKGYLLQKNGHLDRAAHFYRRSIEFMPTAQAHTFLGWVYSLKGLYEEAIGECKKAIAIDPEYGNPYNDIGAYLIQQHRYKDAVPWLEKALQAKNYENYCYPWVNLGRVHQFMGKWDLALSCYLRAIEENPNYEPARSAFEKLQALYN